MCVCDQHLTRPAPNQTNQTNNTPNQNNNVRTDSQSFPYEVAGFERLAYDSYSEKEKYSSQDVADVVRYGYLRGVRVMPEFDSPGLLLLIIITLRGLSCERLQKTTAANQSINKQVMRTPATASTPMSRYAPTSRPTPCTAISLPVAR